VRRVAVQHPDVARVPTAEALQDLDGRRLAGSVRAEEREALAPGDLQVEAGVFA
jgi:hypothetical protein